MESLCGSLACPSLDLGYLPVIHAASTLFLTCDGFIAELWSSVTGK